MKKTSILTAIFLVVVMFALACAVSHYFQLSPLNEFTNWLIFTVSNFSLTGTVDAIKNNSWVVGATSSIVGISGWIKTWIDKKKDAVAYNNTINSTLQDAKDQVATVKESITQEMAAKIAEVKEQAQTKIEEANNSKTLLQEQKEALENQVLSMQGQITELNKLAQANTKETILATIQTVQAEQTALAAK